MVLVVIALAVDCVGLALGVWLAVGVAIGLLKVSEGRLARAIAFDTEGAAVGFGVGREAEVAFVGEAWATTAAERAGVGTLVGEGARLSVGG